MRETKRLSKIKTLLCLFFVIGIVIFLGKDVFPEPKRILNVCLALGAGGLGDRAFNDSAYEGLQNASRELGIRFRIVEYRGKAEQVINLTQAAQEHYDLIVAVGFENGPPMKEVANKFPQLKFAIIDTSVEAPNVSSVLFRELEGDFLAGALCAFLSTHGIVGFLGGPDIPVIRRIEYGWKQGVHHINPQGVIFSEYAGGKDDFSAFNKPDIGQKLTEKMYQSRADIIYAAAGGTVLGAIRAAKEKQKMLITTGTDQRWMAPDVIITSRIKNMSVAVFKLIEELKSGTLKAGVKILDLKAGGVDLVSLEHKRISPEMRKKIFDLRRQLLEGKMKIKEYRPE